MCIWHMPTDQWIHATNSSSLVWIHQASFGPIHAVTFDYQYKTSEQDVHSVIP